MRRARAADGGAAVPDDGDSAARKGSAARRDDVGCGCTRSRLHALHSWLVQPVHASSLGVFRIVFSLCMYTQAVYFSHMFRSFAESVLVLPYPGLSWVRPVSPPTGEMLLLINRISAALVGIGFCTRLSTVALCLTFIYLFVLCESNHNNHYILICHVTALASLSSWGRWGSVDHAIRIYRHRRSSRSQLLNPPPDETVPYWNLLLFQFILSVPYFYGSIAKMNEDWLLHAQPLKIWFAHDEASTAAVPGGFGYTWWFPWFLAWGGFLFDFGIVPLLLMRPMRPISFSSAIAFNCMNKLMFNIGIFPYAMLGSLSLFAEPCFFARLPQMLSGDFNCDKPLGQYVPPRWHWLWMVPANGPLTNREAEGAEDEALVEGARQRKVSVQLSSKQATLLAFVASFCSFHMLWPLRHFVLYPTGVSWHEEGHLHAWHMKLRTKRGWVVLLAEEANGRRTLYNPDDDPLVAVHQRKKIVVRPHALILYATMLSRMHMLAGRNLTALRPISCFSLNARPAAPLFGPMETDLLDYLGRYELIPPLGSSAVGKWLMPMPAYGAQKACDPHADIDDVRQEVFQSLKQAEGPRPRVSLGRFQDLYKQAGVTEELHGQVLAAGQLAYTAGLYLVDEKLASWLAARGAPETIPRSSIARGFRAREHALLAHL